jgi:hypothetical protein
MVRVLRKKQVYIQTNFIRLYQRTQYRLDRKPATTERTERVCQFHLKRMANNRNLPAPTCPTAVGAV